MDERHHAFAAVRRGEADELATPLRDGLGRFRARVERQRVVVEDVQVRAVDRVVDRRLAREVAERQRHRRHRLGRGAGWVFGAAETVAR